MHIFYTRHDRHQVQHISSSAELINNVCNVDQKNSSGLEISVFKISLQIPIRMTHVTFMTSHLFFDPIRITYVTFMTSHLFMFQSE